MTGSDVLIMYQNFHVYALLRVVVKMLVSSSSVTLLLILNCHLFNTGALIREMQKPKPQPVEKPAPKPSAKSAVKKGKQPSTSAEVVEDDVLDDPTLEKLRQQRYAIFSL
jgi:hypothetical protein